MGYKPPRSDNQGRNASQRVGNKLLHRVVTILVHGFDEDTDEFIVELTSATYKKLFGELASQGLLLTDKSLQLPAALEAYNQDREMLLVEQKEQTLLKQQVASQGPIEGSQLASAVAPAGLGADSAPGSHNISARRSPAQRPKHPNEFSPDNVGGIDIAINFGNAFGSDAGNDLFGDADADRQVAQMAADLVGDLMGFGPSASHTQQGTTRHFAISPDQHPNAMVNPTGNEVDLEPLPPILQIEDRLPWRERLPTKGARFRRGLVIGVRNEVTIDVVEERMVYPRYSGRGGRRGGKPQKGESTRPTVAREFFKIRIAGLGAPAPFEEVEDQNEAITVVLSSKGLAIRESIRRMLIGKEVQFSLTDGTRQNADNSLTANVYVAMRERGASPGVVTSSPIARRRGWMNVSQYARCVADISQIEKILEEEASFSTSSSSSDDEGTQQTTAADDTFAIGSTNEGTLTNNDEMEDEEPLENFMPKADQSLFDLNRFNRMLQRGAPTNEELHALLHGTWAVKPNFVPLGPIMPLGEVPVAPSNPFAAPPAAIGNSPFKSNASNEMSRTASNQHNVSNVNTMQVLSNDEIIDMPNNRENDLNQISPLLQADPKIEICYISANAFIKSLQQLGNSVPALMKQQHVAAIIEEFTAPLSMSVYVPALGVQLPFELKHAFLPPVDLELDTAPQTPQPEKEKGGKGKRQGKGKNKGKDAESESQSPKTAYPTLTDRERSVYQDIYNFLDDVLVHRDCWVHTEEIDTKRKCLVGSIAIPFCQLPLRWQSRLEPTKIACLDGEQGITEAAFSPYAGEPVIDILHALVALGMCAITPSEVVTQMPLELLTQVVSAQEVAKEKRIGLWDSQCPTLQDIARAPQRPVSSQIESLITIDSPRPTARARKIVPLKQLDPMSFLFRYDDEKHTEHLVELQELLKTHCRPLPRTARVHPGDFVVIAKRAKPSRRKEDGKKDTPTEEKESGEGPVTYHRAKIVSRVVMHCCRVDYIDSLDTDVNVHLREIRLLDEEGKISAFPPSMYVGRHSFVQLSEEGKKLLAAKQEEASTKDKDGTDPALDEDDKKKGGKRNERGGRGNNKSRPTKQQEKAIALQKEFDDFDSFATALANKDSLFLSADYKTGDEIYGFIFESDKKGTAPDASVPPATVSLLQNFPSMLNIDTSLADESSAFVSFLWHLIDMTNNRGKV